jgi:hypothetical protein
MKPRMLLALAILLVLLMAGSVPAAADGPQVPFRTIIMVQPTYAGPLLDENNNVVGFRLSVEGYGDVMHLGASTWHADMWVNATTAPNTLGADMTFTAANGDTLTGSYLGEGQVVEVYNHCWADFVITGGTGRFANVTGGGKLEGWHPLDGSPGPVAFDGVLLKKQ